MKSPITTNPAFALVETQVLSMAAPASLRYFWNFGSLLGTALALQLGSGVLLAIHYNSSTQLAFEAVDHIMRDVNLG